MGRSLDLEWMRWIGRVKISVDEKDEKRSPWKKRGMDEITVVP
jgi:hypothetical protein